MPSSTPTEQHFWCYKRGLLVLKVSSLPGSFVPTVPLRDDDGEVVDDDERLAPCAFASGQFFSDEWEARIRHIILPRAQDLVELIELLEDRRYLVELEPPSMKARPFRSL